METLRHKLTDFDSNICMHLIGVLKENRPRIKGDIVNVLGIGGIFEIAISSIRLHNASNLKYVL